MKLGFFCLAVVSSSDVEDQAAPSRRTITGAVLVASGSFLCGQDGFLPRVAKLRGMMKHLYVQSYSVLFPTYNCRVCLVFITSVTALRFNLDMHNNNGKQIFLQTDCFAI